MLVASKSFQNEKTWANTAWGGVDKGSKVGMPPRTNPEGLDNTLKQLKCAGMALRFLAIPATKQPTLAAL